MRSTVGTTAETRRYTALIGGTVATVLLATAMVSARPNVEPPPAGDVAIVAELVTDDLDAPVFLTSPPNDPRLFVIEKRGRIRIIEDGELQPLPFLDVTEIVELGPEQGLLGLAFHPEYSLNGRFYVYYTTSDLYSHVVEYDVSADANFAAPGSARTLLSIERPTWRHNAGWMDFGPAGLLYVASGDGAGTNDAHGHGQDQTTLMGTIFRLDVDGEGTAVPEVVAWGLRNPWRASFDGDNIYIGDVGQNNWEEIDILDIGEAPVNFGWSIREGHNCFRADECDHANLNPPIYTYSHAEGCSVTGGYVYRGAQIPELDGQYFFADWCSEFVRSIDLATGEIVDWTPVVGGLGSINSFGTDSSGELYILVQEGRLLVRGGAVYKIQPETASDIQQRSE